MSVKTQILLGVSMFLLVAYFILETLVAVGILPPSMHTNHINYYLLIIFLPIFGWVVRNYIFNSRKIKAANRYMTELNDVLISQSDNDNFYEGNITEGAKSLTREVAEHLGVDRCSIWLYSDQENNSCYCEQLYIKAENKWYADMIINRNDFECYFKELDMGHVVAVNEVEKHPHTMCFYELYLKPKGVHSLLNVPIFYKGDILGFISISSIASKEWKDFEINFVRTLSALYSFAFSVKINNVLNENYKKLEDFVDKSVMYSKTDAKGDIIYVNKKFEEISGWRFKEIMGQNQNFLNSGVHNSEFWGKMYKTTAKDKKIWNSIVTNINKKGQTIWIDLYIKGDFDEDDDLVGYSAIGNDITDVIKSSQEIEKKNAYLEYAAKIIRHDMHSGINIYLPRGIKSLGRRLTPEVIEELKLENPLKMLSEGLKHTQKVYKGVYDFTNLVKADAILEVSKVDVTKILRDYFSVTAYADQVLITKMPMLKINESLFCTAIDNLVRNGLKYNDSETKVVKIYVEGKYMIVEDNGRGMSQDDFNKYSVPYKRRMDQRESGTGLGLNICIAILKEHGFEVTCDKVSTGTKIKIRLK